MIAGEILTLGGSSILRESRERYQATYDEYSASRDNADALKVRIEDSLTAIGDSIKQAMPALAKAEKLLRTRATSRQNLGVPFALDALTRADEFKSQFNSAIAVGAGALAGSSLAVGSWALVSLLGSASTGTVIAGLSGAAATNATLAWFGGGALAAGGAGMSGGAAVLGGLVALPLVYIGAKSTRNKAREFDEETEKLEGLLVLTKAHIESLSRLQPDVERSEGEYREFCAQYVANVGRLVGIIRPYGFLSALKFWLFVIIRREPHSEEQFAALVELGVCVNRFLSRLQQNRQEPMSASEHGHEIPGAR